MFNFFKKSAPKTEPTQKTNSGIGPQEFEIIVNSLMANAINSDQRSRIAKAISGGYDYADTLHCIYLDFGYPWQLDFTNYWNMYRRFGIAKNVVELPVDTTWMSTPTIDADEGFIREIERLDEALSFWVRMKAIDTRQRVGRYAGMFMRVRDGRSPELPIENKLNGIGSLVQMIPFYEGQLQVLDTESDPRSENYGMPTMYQFNSGNAGNRNEKVSSSFSIHPDRIVIVSEDADNGGIYGMSALEAPYNSLMDLRKILGGGGEGFYNNSSQNIVFDLKDGASAQSNAELLEKFNENYDEFIRNRFRRAMWTPGMEARTLDSNLIQPKEFFFNSLYDISASSKIPATILIGQQTGRLASSEDSRSFLSTINSRRQNFGTELIRDVLNWCIRYGILPSTRYGIVWDDLLALSQNEKLDNADKMASINDKQFKSGGVVPFTGDEIRDEAGYDPMEDIPPDSEEIIDDESV